MPRGTAFVKVTTSDYYGRYDSVGGTFTTEITDALTRGDDQFPVKNGMRIRVRWKTGAITSERLVIRRGHDSEQIDMSGGPDDFETRDFVVVRRVHGNKIDVPLRGCTIRPLVPRKKGA